MTTEQQGFFVRSEHGETFLWRGELSYVQVWHEWREWFSDRFNWQNFTLIMAQYEDEKCLGNWSWELGLLGFRMRIMRTYDTGTEMRATIDERMAEIRAHPEVAVELDDILNGRKP